MLNDNQSVIIKPEMSLKLVLEISMLTHERGLVRGWYKTNLALTPRTIANNQKYFDAPLKG